MQTLNTLKTNSLGSAENWHALLQANREAEEKARADAKAKAEAEAKVGTARLLTPCNVRIFPFSSPDHIDLHLTTSLKLGMYTGQLQKATGTH